MFGKLVPVPSGAVIPERDIGKRPILNCINLGVTFGGLKAVAVSDSLNGIIFIIGADPDNDNGGNEGRCTRQCGVHADDYEHIGRHGQHDCRQNEQQRHRQQNVDRTDSRSVCHHDHRDRRLDK